MSPIPLKLVKSSLLRLRVLQVTNLREEQDLQSAHEELETAVVVCGGEAVLAAALEKPNALPYIVSSEFFVFRRTTMKRHTPGHGTMQSAV